MRVLLIRHGQSEGNVDYKKYIEKGDQTIGLTDIGWRQAIAAGEHLDSYYQDTQTAQWPYIFLSAYQRTHETLSGVLHGLGNARFPDTPIIHHDPRLIEQSYGAVPHLNKPDGILDWQTAAQFNRLSLAIRDKDPFTARPLMGESRKDAFLAVQSFMEGAMHRADLAGHDDMVIVAHGHVIQEFLRAMHALPMTADILKPGNCDIFESRGNLGHWTTRRIFDGEAMQPIHQPLFTGNHKFSVTNLPPVPERILNPPPPAAIEVTDQAAAAAEPPPLPAPSSEPQ
ncbi:MAG: histidine phosphatase family protein [Alphaproteobacteria bacterium]